jgi:signal transduction histidine kinase/ActR/RegA family two-component response regulator
MIDALKKLTLSTVSKDTQYIYESISALQDTAETEDEAKIVLRVSDLYSAYAKQIEANADEATMLAAISQFVDTGDWFSKFSALHVSAYVNLQYKNTQDALQNTTQALLVVPLQETYLANYARYEGTKLTAHIYNVKANTDLAIAATDDVISLMGQEFDESVSIDLINNLLYSQMLRRDRKAQNYLANTLLELEQSFKSSTPGLTDLRAAQSRNDDLRFEEAIRFAKQAQEKSDIALIDYQAELAEAIALAGLAREDEARALLAKNNIDLSAQTLLLTETRQDILYAGYLLALDAEDSDLATKLYHRRIDVLSEKLLGASARDTASMLASLENSRERQEERAKAAAREAELQRQTIEKQRALNRVLLMLLALMSAALISVLIFLRYREKIMRKLAIKTKQAASAERLKTEFLGLVSHELRTPLNGVIGLSDILNRTHADADTRFKSGVILESGHRLLAVVDAMTDMARIDAEKMELSTDLIDVPDVLTPHIETARERATVKGLAFTAHIDAELQDHVTDGLRLGQCVGYLLSNAVKFTDAGRVHLHVTATHDAGGAISGMRTIVADTGIGMTELIQSRLFTPFMQADTSTTRQFEGAGLSLAITRALARMMGGDVSVTTREGRGSEFVMDIAFEEKATIPRVIAAEEAVTVEEVEGTVEIQASEEILELETSDIELESVELELAESEEDEPMEVVPVDEAAATIDRKELIDLMGTLHASPVTLSDSRPEDDALAGMRVLVVDDMVTNRDIVRLMLEAEGCSCIEAEDGHAALKILAKERVDVVLMDVFMPGLDGVSATRQLREGNGPNADVPVIALTADNAPQTNADCMAAGVDVFLTKPVLTSELSQALRYAVLGEGVSRSA